MTRNPAQGNIITIDGPAGAGKSTVAKALAAKLNYFFLDTGSMYRAVTLKALRQQIDLHDENKCLELACQTKITYDFTNKDLKVIMDGNDVSEEIRTPEVTNQTSLVASKPKVREIIVGWQRAIAQQHNIVAEGRDMATVVFPHAQYKFYLDADPNERAERRLKELKLKGETINHAEMKKDIMARDEKDMTRKASPLKKADDAIFIDSTGLNVDQSVEKILKHIKL